MITQKIYIKGMTCLNCQNKIERRLKSIKGIKKAFVSYPDEYAEISYDETVVDLKNIKRKIEKLDYKVFLTLEEFKRGKKIIPTALVLLVIVLAYLFLQYFGVLNFLAPGQLAEGGMGYGMLFIIGIVTSVHCVAMCGGINLSQSIKAVAAESSAVSGAKTRSESYILSSLLYNIGRVVSYTVIGAALGFLGMLLGGGSQIGIPLFFQGGLKIIAGLFMVVMGLNMLEVFPWLRKYQLRFPRLKVKKVGRKSPFIIGLLNGLMPCGPLQSIQIVALASGSPLSGGLSMLFFSLGTLPLMLGFGSAVSFLGKRFASKVMKAGSVLVTVLGLAMLSQGGGISGLFSPEALLIIIAAFFFVGLVLSFPFPKKIYTLASVFAIVCVSAITFHLAGSKSFLLKGKADTLQNVTIVDGKQVVKSSLLPNQYPNISVKEGVPVKWIIDAPKGTINGCNNRIFIHEYGIEHSFKTGENVIEFTPTKTGDIKYSCWMGMMFGSISVLD